MSWEIAWPLGVLILGIAIAYGYIRSKKRDRAEDRHTEEVVKANYDDPEGAPHR